MNTNPLARKLRGALAIGVALALAAPVVNAQEEDEPLEEIITTGSRIARDEFSYPQESFQHKHGKCQQDKSAEHL